MAKIVPIRSTPTAPPRRTGLRGWFGRLRDVIDRLVYQLIRMPSRRVGRETDPERGKQ